MSSLYFRQRITVWSVGGGRVLDRPRDASRERKHASGTESRLARSFFLLARKNHGEIKTARKESEREKERAQEREEIRSRTENAFNDKLAHYAQRSLLARDVRALAWLLL